jgi:hypothetical protein
MNIELTDLERKARELISADREATEFSSVDQVLRMALQACWSSAMPAERWTAIGRVIANYGDPVTEEVAANYQKALTAMVRRKVLRSYVKSGVRLYEINY